MTLAPDKFGRLLKVASVFSNAARHRQPLCNTWMIPALPRRSSTRGPPRALCDTNG